MINLNLFGDLPNDYEDVLPTYIGIDPGMSGGLAYIRGEEIRVREMPVGERDIVDWLWPLTFPTNKCSAMIEKVGGFIPGNTSEDNPSGGQPGSAMFKFGQSYGSLRMALTATDISFDEVIPRTWQKEIGIQARLPGESKGHFKARLKAKAQQLFPRINLTLKTCDALLIALYCKRKYEG